MFPDELLKRRQVEDSKNFILHKDRGLKLSLINWRIQDQAISVAIEDLAKDSRRKCILEAKKGHREVTAQIGR